VNNGNIYCVEKCQVIKIKSSQKLLFMPPRVEGVVQNLHFQVFIYILNLFFQHDHPNSYDLFFCSIDVCICVGHNGKQSGKGVKYRVTI